MRLLIVPANSVNGWGSVAPRPDSMTMATRCPSFHATMSTVTEMPSASLVIRKPIVSSPTLSKDKGEMVWRWRGALSFLRGLEALIGERLAALDADARAAVEVIAFGESLGPAVVDVIAPQHAVIAPERSGLVNVTEDGHRLLIGCAHPLYGELIRGTTPVLRRRGEP